MTAYLIKTPDRDVRSCVTILKLIILLFIIINYITCGWDHMWVGMAAKHTSKMKLSVAENRNMIQKIEKDEYNDIVKKVIENIETGVMGQDLEERKDFMLIVCLKSKELLLVKCIMDIILLFLDLREHHSKRWPFARKAAIHVCQLLCDPTQCKWL